MGIGKCMICGGELVPAELDPYSPVMPYAIVKDETGDEKKIDIKPYICKRCGNLTARHVEKEKE